MSDNKFNLELKVSEARTALERCNRDYDKELQDLESKHKREISRLELFLTHAEYELRWETHMYDMIEEATKKLAAELVLMIQKIIGG